MTCHNRVDKTLKCLSTLLAQSISEEQQACQVFLVDDGSTDETGRLVKEQYPQAHVIYGDGDLFWNRGMHRAFGAALDIGFDYYLWLNDDTYLYPDSLQQMLNTHKALSEEGRAASIVVASTRDPGTGKFSYGGYRRTDRFNPLSLHLVRPEEGAIPCDTMCGNCVLIPREVADVVGNIDPEFRHRWGDVDYGLRARARKCQVWIAPGYLADCEGNPKANRWRDKTLPFKQRYTELHSIKGIGRRDWFRHVRKHGGMFWPLIWGRPYMRIIVDTFR